MNADTFDAKSNFCPVCHRAGVVKSPKLIAGLLTCQQCRTRLVVSWSGHYVRDPFTLKCLATEQRLRRESRPIARIYRDFALICRPLVLLALLGSVVGGAVAVSHLTVLNPSPRMSETLSVPDADGHQSPHP
jgi:hypothetical protein